ncbi:MAG: V-type ATPase 116kDa subunit family protein, partial [Clostridiales bacterium]|nr:V-type ATPase 116kDa subunit family protein [Clostridiales bacterium]
SKEEEGFKNIKITKSANNPWKKMNMEKQIEDLEERINNLEFQINEYSHNYEKLNSIYSEKLELEQQLEALMEEYFR